MPIDFFALLVVHALCNAKAETMVLSAPEANQCSENFDRLKISLHPNITVEQFQSMEPSQRAKLSVEAYAYYRRWIGANAEIYAQLNAGARLMATAGM